MLPVTRQTIFLLIVIIGLLVYIICENKKETKSIFRAGDHNKRRHIFHLEVRLLINFEKIELLAVDCLCYIICRLPVPGYAGLSGNTGRPICRQTRSQRTEVPRRNPCLLRRQG